MDKTTQKSPPLGEERKGLRVTLIQMDIKWGDITANCDTASRIINSHPGSQLYVLPEMWSTGFATEPEGIADDSLQSLTWMQQKANAINAAIAGSVATKCEDGTFRNRFYFVAPQPPKGESLLNAFAVDKALQQTSKTIFQTPPSGAGGLSPSGDGGLDFAAFYDKHHLFTYGGEQNHYTAGQDRVIVEWQGVRFLLQICYDLRFPCFSRNIERQAPQPPKGESLKNAFADDSTMHSTYNTYNQTPPSGAGGLSPSGAGGLSPSGAGGLEAFEAIIYVASWPTSRIEPWRALLKARAIENQCYVLGVDRIGTDPACSYCGGTECIDPYGRVIAACPDNEEGAITIDLDMDSLSAFRKKFPVLNDAD